MSSEIRLFLRQRRKMGEKLVYMRKLGSTFFTQTLARCIFINVFLKEYDKKNLYNIMQYLPAVAPPIWEIVILRLSMVHSTN